MPIETMLWSTQDKIQTPERQRDYLEAAFENGDPATIAAAIEDVAKARGLDRASTSQGASAQDPRLSTILAVMKVVGLALSVKPIRTGAA